MSENLTSERLLRRELARELTARYAFALDDRNWAELAALFADDAILSTSEGVVEGRAAITNWYREYMESAMPGWAGRHFIVNQRFPAESGSDELTMQAYFFYTFQGITESIVGWGRYLVVARFVEGDAQFSRLTIEVNSQTDVREGWPL